MPSQMNGCHVPVLRKRGRGHTEPGLQADWRIFNIPVCGCVSALVADRFMYLFFNSYFHFRSGSKNPVQGLEITIR